VSALLTGEFWNAEQLRLFEEFQPMVTKAVLSGATAGANMLPPQLQAMVDWTVFNKSAIDFIHQYQLSSLAKITDHTRERIIDMMDKWIQSGTPLSTLKKQLRMPGLFDETRADRIAATEVTRAFAEGNQIMWESTGMVGGKKWQTSKDEMVCPVCRPFHNKVVDLSGKFTVTPLEIARSPAMRKLLSGKWTMARAMKRAASITKNLGGIHKNPPAHPHCRCWVLPVVSLSLVEERIGAIWDVVPSDRGAQLPFEFGVIFVP